MTPISQKWIVQVRSLKLQPAFQPKRCFQCINNPWTHMLSTVIYLTLGLGPALPTLQEASEAVSDVAEAAQAPDVPGPKPEAAQVVQQPQITAPGVTTHLMFRVL